jgi:hypothetical protein
MALTVSFAEPDGLSLQSDTHDRVKFWHNQKQMNLPYGAYGFHGSNYWRVSR